MNSSANLILPILCLLPGAISAQQGYSHRIDGAGSSSRLGRSLSVCSDNALQPDGLPDIVTTNYSEILWWSVSGPSPQLTDAITGLYSLLDGTISGFELDGDQWDELFVPTSSGAASKPDYVYSGAYPHTVLSTWYGENNAFPVGDIDSDGTPDLATFDGSNLRIRSGASLAGTIVLISDQDLGYACAPLGDVNMDGYADFAATGPSIATGSLKAFAGGSVASAGALLWTFYAQNPSDRLEALVNVGDWDGDGYSDLAVGSPGYDYASLSNSGRIYVVSGVSGAEIVHLEGFAAGLAMGAERRLAAGDLTGDGQAELIVGLPGYDPGGAASAGAVRVYEWDGVQLNLIRGFDGSSGGDQFGYRVAFGNDMDGDGISDFIASSPYADTSVGNDSGSVFVFPGISAGAPVLSAPQIASPGQVLPVSVSNAPIGSHVVLLGGPSAGGSLILGHVFDIGTPHYVLAAGGPTGISGTVGLSLPIPNPFPRALPFNLKLEAMVIDPGGMPFSSVLSTNLTSTVIQ